MYTLNEQRHVVDAYGRVLIGADGVAIEVSQESVEEPRMRTSAVQPIEMTASSSSNLTGWSKGKARAKAPKVNNKACDLPLATVLPGATPGTFFYVAELLGKCGNIVKCWRQLQNISNTDDIQLLEQRAWVLIQQTRETYSASQKAGLLTPEQDKERLEKMSVKPSVLVRREKDRKTREQRAARGLTSRGVVRK